MRHGFEIAFLIITTPASNNDAPQLREYEERQRENIEYAKLSESVHEKLFIRGQSGIIKE